MSIQNLFEQLLSDTEGYLVDFKRQNYDFEGKDKPEKEDKVAEFVKDIICFANTIRDKSAYIVIGVSCNDKGEKSCLGIDKHIDDAIYQSKIKNKVHPIPKIRYIPIDYKDKIFGLIEIPIVKYPEPCKVVNKLKGLEVKTVYLRRSSQNDEAQDFEIADLFNWLKNLKEGLTYTEEKKYTVIDFYEACVSTRPSPS